MKIIGQIFEETNYDCFRKLPDNRDVLSARFNKLVASISEKYVLNPIIVNEKMEIIDGQGRFEALKHLGKPIHYIISPGTTSDDCRRMNKYNTAWGILDFAKSYANSGIESYQNLLLAAKKTSLPISQILRLANHGTSGKASYEQGKLNFTLSDVSTVEDVCSKMNDITEALIFTGRKNNAFYVGVKIMTETAGYDHSRMIANCKALRSTFSQMAKLTDQLVEFERIYNHRARLENRLYFSDYMRKRGGNVRDYSKSALPYSPYSDKDVSTLRKERVE